MKPKPRKVVKAWAGMCNNKIHVSKELDTNYNIMAIYPTKKLAKLAYEEVILVEIREITPSQSKQKG